MVKKITSIKKIISLGVRDLRLTEMNGEKKFDIRKWHNDDKYDDGVRFTWEELIQIKNGEDIIGDKTLVLDGEWCLQLMHNGRLYSRPFATESEMDKLKDILAKCNDAQSLVDYDDKPTVKAEESKAKEEKKKGNIIQFPKAKPEITDKLVTDGNATYEECEDKIAKEKELYKDGDSQYVLDGILELCKVDSDFRNNVMREDKTFGGAFEYMSKMAKDGYGYKVGANAAILDRDMGLGFVIDYYNSKPEPPKETTKKKTTTTKKTTKKKGA